MSKHHHHKKRILFLLKENSYGSYGIAKSGLLNSVKLLVRALRSRKLVEEAVVRICTDANSIDRELFIFKPDICFLEAIWVTGKKLAEIQRLHPKVTFIVRIHSNIPFLAMEGNAIERLNEYKDILNTYISFNNKFTNDYFDILFAPIYLPNVYFRQQDDYMVFEREHLNVGCFGAIRPFKNQLTQAVAAINYGFTHTIEVHFHINASRLEQQGEGVLKNLRALFEDTPHQLVEHKWMSHDAFLLLVQQMDIGLQVSFSESFNIVTADFVSTEVPIIVSDDIYWMPTSLKVNPNDVTGIELKMREVLNSPKRFIRRQSKALLQYNSEAIDVWEGFLG